MVVGQFDAGVAVGARACLADNQCLLSANLINMAPGQQLVLVAVDAFQISFNELELEGGTAAIEDEYFHSQASG